MHRSNKQYHLYIQDNDFSDLLKQKENEEDKMNRYLRFQGVGWLYSDKAHNDLHNKTLSDPHLHIVDRLHNSTVAVIGIGGVGSWTAEALCRSGVGNLILIDLDDICISNTNRQLHATSTTIGKMKTDEMKRRMLEINPQCHVTCLQEFITENNTHQILENFLPDLDIVVDAIDSRKAKTALIAACAEENIPIVTCGGSAGLTNPTKISVQDLTRVNGDNLLKSTRYHLRKFYGFPDGEKWHVSKGKPKKWGITAIFSTEAKKKKSQSDDLIGTLRTCDGVLGTACFVTGTFGFVAAGEVIQMLASNDLVFPKKL